MALVYTAISVVDFGGIIAPYASDTLHVYVFGLFHKAIRYT